MIPLFTTASQTLVMVHILKKLQGKVEVFSGVEY